MLCAIWYHLYNLKNMKNTQGGVILLLKLQASTCSFTKRISSNGITPRFLKCTNGTKSRKASHIDNSVILAFPKAKLWL